MGTLADIDHFVVLMLENRSFDHMLGYAAQKWAGVNGLTGKETNPRDPGNPHLGTVSVSSTADYHGVLVKDPGHSIADVQAQLCGNQGGAFCTHGRNDGFVWNYGSHAGDAYAEEIMRCFDPARLPALTTLAEEFAVCDSWHSSMPGPTWPNRFFVHCATSGGYVDNGLRLYRMRTIYEHLSEAGHKWRIYYHDFPQSLALQRLWIPTLKRRFRKFSQFESDAARGKLPSYSFIEPRYFNLLWKHANDQHPDHDVRLGEELIATTYKAIRSSPAWDRTMLVILYDEHGGTFDHVFPAASVKPDDLGSQGFDFTRFGPRVPAVVVSAWTAKGTVLQSARPFDHSTIPATLKERFRLPAFLTERDTHAADLAGAVNLAKPRWDAPAAVPLPDGVQEDAALAARPLTAAAVRSALEDNPAPRTPLSEYQRSLVDLADALNPPPTELLGALRAARVPVTEHDGAVHVRSAAEEFLR